LSQDQPKSPRPHRKNQPLIAAPSDLRRTGPGGTVDSSPPLPVAGNPPLTIPCAVGTTETNDQTLGPARRPIAPQKRNRPHKSDRASRKHVGTAAIGCPARHAPPAQARKPATHRRLQTPRSLQQNRLPLRRRAPT